MNVNVFAFWSSSSFLAFPRETSAERIVLLPLRSKDESPIGPMPVHSALYLTVVLLIDAYSWLLLRCKHGQQSTRRAVGQTHMMSKESSEDLV